MSDANTFTCPSCGAANPADPAFVAWCSTCNYNVDPDGMAARQAAQQTGAAKPLSFAGRFGIGLLVHGTVALTLLLGAFLIWATWFSIVGAMAGCGLLLLGALLLPHGGRIPDNAVMLDPVDDAAFYDYVAAIANEHGVGAPHRVGFHDDFRSWSGVVGALQRPALVLSYPIWQCLDRAEAAAFVALELESHAARRRSVGRWSEAATQSLATIVSGSQWHRPTSNGHPLGSATNPDTVERFGGEADGPTLGKTAALLRPDRPLFGLAYFLLERSRRGTESTIQAAVVEAHQRVADRRGSEVVLRLLDIELMASSMINAAVRARRRDESLLDTIAGYADLYPDHERQRRRREAQLRGAVVDGSWPTVGARAEAVAPSRSPVSPPLVPPIAHATLRGTIELRLFDHLTIV